MKTYYAFLSVFLLINAVFGQISGNINYENQVHLHNSNFNVNPPNPNQISLSIKGMANVKADAYLAIFSVTQVGLTQEEAQKLIDQRIENALAEIQSVEKVETYVDFISFVPKYEYEIHRKIFSKKTYNEVPVGFEIKKNVHLKFVDPRDLDEFIQIFTKHEIYDLVRVDYYAAEMEKIKMDLQKKAKDLLGEKMAIYTEMLGENFDEDAKTFSDGFLVKLPVELYQSYVAANSQTLNLRKSANVNQVDKSPTIHYQPIFNKEFDFVVNPIIVEPVIQVMYEFKMLIIKNPKVEKSDKEYMMITPNGDLKTLNLPKN